MTSRTRWLVVLCTLATALGWGQAHARRIALVIGNDNYQQVARLEKAGNDAEAMARELTAAGFEVRKHRDLNFKQMVVAFEAFFDQIKGGDDVAVFYAGHGVQTDRGSYLLPTDIEGDTQSQIEKISYSVNGLLEELDKVKPRFSLIIVDACRDNPLRSRGRTIGVARGLNAPDLAKGQMVVFSAGKNQKALDSLNDRDSNPNGVFTRELISRMRRPGVTVEALALDVKNSVERLARTVNHDQRPLIVNDSTGDFYFFGTGAATASTPAAGPANDAAREDQFWLDAKAPDNIEAYEAYLGAYPSGRYAGLARANISRLRARPGATEPVAAPGPATRITNNFTELAAAAAQTPAPVAAERPAGADSTAKTVASYTLSNGDRYQGDTLGAMRTGKGTYQFANGDRYEGELLNNQFNGRGTMRFAYGDSYTGGYLRGQKHGPGVYEFANKDRFEGSFVDNLYQGRGSFIYANGDRYDGDYLRGAKHGRGVFVFANGERFEGGYADNQFEGQGSYLHASGDRYEGGYQRGVKQGLGVYRFANGDRYEGPFVNNQFHGRGKLFLASGDRYEGEFKDNAKDGVGVHTFASQERYEGTFKAGAQSGSGTHYFANGDRYVGAFEAGVRHGKGVHHFANGQTKNLEYVQGTEKTN
jgi:hypothetical protein